MAVVKYNKTNFFNILKALVNQGYTGKTLLFALAQSAHETAGFTNDKIVSHNNPSGITFANNPAKQKNATRGRQLPEAPKYNYAKFNTLNDWAVDFNRLVGSALKSSPDTSTYAKKLADRGYYEVSARYPNAIQNYTDSLQFHLKNIQRIIVDNINKFTSLNLPKDIQLTDNTLPIATPKKDSKNNTISPILVVALAFFAFSLL